MLSTEQVAHFNTFGFIVLPHLLSSTEVSEIQEEFDEVMLEERQGESFRGVKRQAVMAFAELRPKLLSLIDDNRIYEPIEQLLGPDFLWWGSDGNLYVGDTAWHPDATNPELGHSRIKVAMYLDNVTKDTGCIRFIPGSHRIPLHTDLHPLRMWRTIQVIAEGRTGEASLKPFLDQGLDPNKPVFGIDQADLPGYSIESNPGDVIMFEQHIFHGSWGGHTGRRMFTLNYFANPTTEDQIAVIKDMHHQTMGTMQALSFRQRDQAHENTFLQNNRPRIKRMVSKLQEFGLT